MVFIIGATNRPDILDSSVTRPGGLTRRAFGSGRQPHFGWRLRYGDCMFAGVRMASLSLAKHSGDAVYLDFAEKIRVCPCVTLVATEIIPFRPDRTLNNHDLIHILNTTCNREKSVELALFWMDPPFTN
ncbi:unnamed protein product [Ectocarpus sp. 13 AM-2016]